MSNALVELIAIELFAIDREDRQSISEQWQRYDWKKDYREIARLALMTIETSRTHVVVPVAPTNEMLMPFFHAHNDASGTITFEATYAAILAARPKVPG